MKILDVGQIRKTDEHTIENEPISSLDLMERAAAAFTNWFRQKFSAQHRVKIFCGIGNNGGDGLVIGRLLRHHHYNVEVYAVRISDKSSPDFQANEKRLKEMTDVPFTDLHNAENPPDIRPNDIVIDAIFGSGLNRPIEGFANDLIQHINQQNPIGVAVDIPSGLYADAPSDSTTFQADYTISFQLPKYSFFFPENAPSVGQWEPVSIGLSQSFIDKQETTNFYLTPDDVRPLLRDRQKFGHKGTYGHALMICGSYGSIGAAQMSARGCLKSGAGLVTAHIPKCGYDSLQAAVPEVMLTVDNDNKEITQIPDLSDFDTVGVGCGIGQSKSTQQAFHELLKKVNSPMVIDADGINILAENEKWLHKIPEHSILTPHPGEFRRLAGESDNSYEQNQEQRELSQRYGLYIVLKRAHTAITTPEGHCYFNSTGNPGMATAGSGDVLTGMLTGLLAQGYQPEHAALLGVYLHGLAGDIATCKETPYSVTATDIIEHISEAYERLKWR